MFDASGSFDSDGWIATFSFDFGDGTQVIQAGQWRQAWHTYNSPGSYIVTVTATDDEGGSTSVSKHIVIVLNVPPTASFTFSCTGPSCSFDASGSADSDGMITGYSWSFGDGMSGSGKTATHVYAGAGGYTVTLTVTDNGGAAATGSIAVNPISLAARGYKQNGLQKVDLAWSGPSGTSFDVYRDGAKVTTVRAAYYYTDTINKRGSGSYTYKVCAPATSSCSNDATVTF
jgi:PKD repeat protein